MNPEREAWRERLRTRRELWRAVKRGEHLDTSPPERPVRRWWLDRDEQLPEPESEPVRDSLGVVPRGGCEVKQHSRTFDVRRGEGWVESLRPAAPAYTPASAFFARSTPAHARVRFYHERNRSHDSEDS